jgi:hypothetical protein
VFPAERPFIVSVTPVPTFSIVPGYLITVHVPEEGKPIRMTLPVARVHVGDIILLITGAVGVDGLSITVKLADGGETQLAAFVTVKVYEPLGTFGTENVAPDKPLSVDPTGSRVNE